MTTSSGRAECAPASALPRDRGRGSVTPDTSPDAGEQAPSAPERRATRWTWWLSVSFSLLLACGDSSSQPPGSQADATVNNPADSGTSAPADASSTPAADASTSPMIDAATSTGMAGSVVCADSTCDLTTGNVCCISISGSQCTPAGDCGGGFSAPQHCDGPEDCSGGEACCAVFSFGGDVGSFCRTTCDTNSEGNEAELCHTTADCTDPGELCRTCEFPGAPAQKACAGTDIPACN